MTETFNPDWASCPGETIKEYCEEKDQLITDQSCYRLLYDHLELSPVKFMQLMTGVLPINEKIADLLAEVFEESTPQFWLELEQQFVNDLDRLGITREWWVQNNSDYKLYKGTVTHEFYFVGPSDLEVDSSSCKVLRTIMDIAKESLTDSMDIEDADFESVVNRAHLCPQWEDALAYMYPDIKLDPVLDVVPELTCLQVLKANGIA